MTNINFRKTPKGYSADFQRNDGFGFERRFFKASDLHNLAMHYGWQSADDKVHTDECTVAEMLIVQDGAKPYRVVFL
jgi:hypothetical protein